VGDDLVESVGQKICETALHDFRIFVWISTYFTQCSLWDYHRQGRLSQVLHKMVSTIMRGWWKVSKRGWAQWRQTSLTHGYKNLFPDTSASIQAVTTLRSCLSMYFFYI
jgi:hypothetical protein